MKYCPTCQTRYDEEILRFCMKDGTPLIEEDEPAFIQMPSESIDDASEDDVDEVTVIRKSGSIPVPPPQQTSLEDISFSPDPPSPGQRIVVPTTEAPAPTRPRVIPAYQPPPRSNTAKVIVLTVIGTLLAVAVGAFVLRLLQVNNENDANINTNFNSNFANLNTNVNTNLGFDSNFNFNTNANVNQNLLSNLETNVNANVRTPTPTPKPSPTASPSPTPSPTMEGDVLPPTPSPTQTPIVVRPRTSPTVPRMNPLPTNRPANAGDFN